MQKRISHNKSRKGCQNCKNRHVKCDEQGPPCANCTVRNITSTCTYISKNSVARRPARTKLCQDVPSSSSSTIAESPTSQIIDFPCGSGRLLELELMHRWTISTYLSFCSMPDDYHYLRVEFPKYSFKFQFLLNGIMALSSLDVAMCIAPSNQEDLRKYSRLAMEYYDKASTQFRAELSNITSENIHGILLFSYMTMSMNMAIPQCAPDEEPQSLLSRIPVLFELNMNSSRFFLSYSEWIMKGPFANGIRNATRFMQGTPPTLDSSAALALERLASIVQNGASISNDGLLSQVDLSRLEMYQTTLSHIYTCYIEDARNIIQGFCFGFPSMAGPGFTSAIRDLEPTALFILMHWAVLLNRCDDRAFWARSIGVDLVKEISETMKSSYPEITQLPDWSEGIDWARQEVGLVVERQTSELSLIAGSDFSSVP